MPEGLRDRIWITAHIRMKSERRLRQLSKILTWGTIWYSTMLTCLTVYQLVVPNDAFRAATSTALAIVVLAFSIFVPSLKLDHEADRFRECYLKLQRLLDTIDDDKLLQTAYYDVLDAYPNHLTSDRTDFIVSTYLLGQTVTNAGHSITPTFTMHASYWLRRARNVLLTALGGTAPALLYSLI